jgi:hypothetical protein
MMSWNGQMIATPPASYLILAHDEMKRAIEGCPQEV